jgi:hypothetical protein
MLSHPLQTKASHNKSPAGANCISIASFAVDLFAAATFYVIIQRNDQLCDAERADCLHEQYFGALQCVPLSTIQNSVIVRKGFFSLQS